ncbi:MAG TPA: alpha/beta fold hydrolase [Bacteroidota bacterium]|nr:alpha/beta fold hydrolase [Bacteroidota bacterium]
MIVPGLLLLFLRAFPLTAQPVEEGWKQINGVRLYYKMIGSGEPILVVHGGPGLEHSYFLPQMEDLARTHRLIFFDHRGHGKSDIPGDTTAMGITNFVNDIEELRKEFNLGTMNLMGHSWGGLVAMWYAVTYPHNLKSLLLINSTSPRSEDRIIGMAEVSKRTTRQDSVDRAAILRSEDFRARKAEAFERLFRINFRALLADRRFADSLRLRFPPDYAVRNRVLQYLRKDLDSYDLTNDLRLIDVPTLILHGDSDPTPVEISRSLQSHIHGSTLVILERAGHFPFVEQPTAFRTAIDTFLNSLE